MFHKPLFKYCLLLFLLFLIIFPKGGIKIGGIPLTWGYFLLGIFSFWILLIRDYRFNHTQVFATLCFIPFQVMAISSFFINGTLHGGYLIAFIVTFLILPFCFFILFGEYTSFLFTPQILSFLRRGISLMVIYGITTFLIKTIFGYFLHIPFLTMNFSDLASFDTSKCIERGSLFKLISTYTNGNLYGVCLLMLTPLYYQIESRKMPLFLLRVSFLLTLSRTVWIGYILFETLYFFCFSKKKVAHFIYLGLLIILFMMIIGYLLPKITDVSITEFLFDRTIGGRLSEEKIGITPRLFSTKPFLNISEIVYMGMVENFGILGLFTYLIALLAPFVIWVIDPYTSGDNLHKAIGLGLVNYWILSFSDGCILLIPTMAIYLGLSSALLSTSSEEFSLRRARNSLIS